MISRFSLYNRLGLLCQPILALAAGSITLWIYAGGGWFEGADMVLFVGQSRVFPLVAATGLIVGLLDWLVPTKRALIISGSALANLLSLFMGWVTAQAIIHM